MNPLIKTFLMAAGMAAVFFSIDYFYSAWLGDPASFSKVTVILMITYFAFQIAHKSDGQPPEEGQSD
jgi:uncharacterized membrane protein